MFPYYSTAQRPKLTQKERSQPGLRFLLEELEKLVPPMAVSIQIIHEMTCEWLHLMVYETTLIFSTSPSRTAVVFNVSQIHIQEFFSADVKKE